MSSFCNAVYFFIYLSIFVACVGFFFCSLYVFFFFGGVGVFLVSLVDILRTRAAKCPSEGCSNSWVYEPKTQTRSGPPRPSLTSWSQYSFLTGFDLRFWLSDLKTKVTAVPGALCYIVTVKVSSKYKLYKSRLYWENTGMYVHRVNV